MIIKFRLGATDWMLLDGFDAVHHFCCVKGITSAAIGDATTPDIHWQAVSGEDAMRGDEFFPDNIYRENRRGRVPRNIGLVCYRGADKTEKFLIDSDEIFILNDQGKTIERI